jgi:hypothetical protein
MQEKSLRLLSILSKTTSSPMTSATRRIDLILLDQMVEIKAQEECSKITWDQVDSNSNTINHLNNKEEATFS